MMVKNTITRLVAPPRKLLEWAYRRTIIPSLAYGASAWATKLDNKNFMVKLRQVNRLAMLLLAKGINRSTLTHAMEILLDFPPLDLLINLLRSSDQSECGTWVPWDGDGHGKQREPFLMLTTELGSIWNQSYFLDMGWSQVTTVLTLKGKMMNGGESGRTHPPYLYLYTKNSGYKS